MQPETHLYQRKSHHGVWLTACCSFCLRRRRDHLSHVVRSLSRVMARLSQFGQRAAMVFRKALCCIRHLQGKGQERNCLYTIVRRKLHCLHCTLLHRTWIHQFCGWSIFHHLAEFHSRWHLPICGGDGQSLLAAQLQHTMWQSCILHLWSCRLR